jgi:hypothetical protein
MTSRRLIELVRLGLQYGGLLGSVTALATSLFVDRYGFVFAVASALAIGLDIVAIRTRWDRVAILAAIGKGIVVLLSMSVLFLGGPTELAPSVPSEVPFNVLLSSSIATFFGALARRFTR